jgi:membrane protein required for beta-lactamase induction
MLRCRFAPLFAILGTQSGGRPTGLWPRAAALLLLVAAAPAAADDPCRSEASVRGIDVSRFQGDIDWPAVKAAGISFAFARVSDGVEIIDATFEAKSTPAQPETTLTR